MLVILFTATYFFLLKNSERVANAETTTTAQNIPTHSESTSGAVGAGVSSASPTTSSPDVLSEHVRNVSPVVTVSPADNLNSISNLVQGVSSLVSSIIALNNSYKTEIAGLKVQINGLQSKSTNQGYTYYPGSALPTTGINPSVGAISQSVSAPSGIFENGVTAQTGTFTGTLSGGSITTAGTLSVTGASTLGTLTVGSAFYVDPTTGRVGIGTSTPSDAFSLNGAMYFAHITPTQTASRLYNSGGDLYWSGNLIGGATTGTWTTDGTNAWRMAGNVGIGTTSPYAKLSVAGDGYFSGALNVGDATTTRSNLGLTYASSSDMVAVSIPIATWGDSLTNGYNTASSPYPLQLSQLSKYTVYNGGVGGDTSAQILTRMLADTSKLSWPTLIWAGRNDVSQGISSTIIKSNIASMVATLTTNKYIILGVLNRNSEPSGSANYTIITQLNSDLSGIYGSHFVDIRSYLITNGLNDAGITPTAQDLTDIGNDVVPTSLNDGGLHLNNAGYGVVARQVYAKKDVLGLNTQYTSSLLPSLTTLRQVHNDASAGYSISGQRVLYATSTNGLTTVGVEAATLLSSAALYNTAIGYRALFVATSSANVGNTALGYEALYSNTTGSSNTAQGAYALQFNTTGNNNTANGYQALLSNTTGSGNTANGHLSLTLNSIGLYNTAIGFSTLRFNTSGSNNTASGREVLFSNTTGSGNTASGIQSLYFNTTGSNNSATGYQSLFYNRSATSSVAIGTSAAMGTANYSNQFGTYVGFESGKAVQTGSNNNAFFGYQSGLANTTGANNSFFGYQAGSNITSGSNNLIIGYGVSAPSPTLNKQLNIGNLIFGTGIDGTGTILSSGNVGIGTTTPYAKLSVVGPVVAEYFNATSTTATSTFGKVAVTSIYDSGVLMTAPDYVFDDPNYKLLTVDEIETYINENKHLPWVTARGLGGMSLSARINEILESVENLFLQLFNLNSKVDSQEKRIQDLERENGEIKLQMQSLIENKTQTETTGGSTTLTAVETFRTGSETQSGDTGDGTQTDTSNDKTELKTDDTTNNDGSSSNDGVSVDNAGG